MVDIYMTIGKASKQKIGGNTTVINQVGMLFITLLVLSFALLVLIKNEIDLKSACILAAVCLIFGAILLFSFSFNDIYLLKGEIFMNRITGTKKRPVSDFKSIGTILGGIFYMEFNDGKKVLFQLGLQQTFDRLNGVDITKVLTDKIIIERSKYVE